jgi:hypothetical protein
MSKHSELLDDRLRELAWASAAWCNSADGHADMARRAREARRDARIDMSDAALDARLRRMASMTELCVALSRLAV